jgi:molybdopterin-guanine dinucleotide biosynthesis protein A
VYRGVIGTESHILGINCIALAGGKGLRLGRDKLIENIGDRSVLERVVSCLSLFDSDIIVVRSAKQSVSGFIDYPKLRVVADFYPEKGPLGGIYTGLTASDSFYNIVVACDMPFLNQALLRYMVQLSADYDLVVPRLGNMVEPLHAVYSKDCIEPIEDLLKQGILGVTELFTIVKVRYVEAGEIDRFDPEHRSFFNINTESDVRTARALVKERKEL